MQKVSGFGIASLVLSIIGFILAFCFMPISIVLSVLSIIFGVVGIVISKSGMGIAGLIIGIISLIISMIMLFIFMGVFDYSTKYYQEFSENQSVITEINLSSTNKLTTESNKFDIYIINYI